MQEILSVENMRKSDANTIATKVPGRDLMFRAGKAVFEAVDWKAPVAVVCGSGNNAGDGYVIASLLHDKGIDCTLVLLEERFSEDGRFYFEKCKERGIKVAMWSDARPAETNTPGEISGMTETDTPGEMGGMTEADTPGEAGKLSGSSASENASEFCTAGELRSFAGFSTIVDCIFGTGFRGAASGKAAAVIDAINRSDAFVVSVDINSGLNGNTGVVAGVCVKSDLTASIGSFKPGHFLNMAKDVMKKKINLDIGIEPVDRPFYRLETADLGPYFGARSNFSNKGDFGYIALIGGSKRYSGAIRLAAMANAAMRAGAGVVKVAVPESLFGIVAANVLESTLFPLSDSDGEMVFCEKEIAELVKNVKTVAFGMGIGVTAETGKTLEYLLQNYAGKLIIDADGLTLLSKMDRSLIRNSRAKLVLTPHLKEFSRLTGLSIDEILAAPVETAKSYARENGVTLLLKGPATIITDGEDVIITDTGCPGMATAGSGDVLSGILSAVCAYLPAAIDKAKESSADASKQEAAGLLQTDSTEQKQVDAVEAQQEGIMEHKPVATAPWDFLMSEDIKKSDSSNVGSMLLAVAAGAYINGRAGELAQQQTNSISMVAGDTVSCIAAAITELAAFNETKETN